MKSILPAACLALICSSLHPASASTLTVSVGGASGPWLQAVNPALPYGSQPSNGAQEPTVIASASGDLLTGSAYQFAYVSGFTRTNPSYPAVDGIGDTAIAARSNYPSHYASLPSGQIAYLEELVGAFADSSGKVVGTPFVIGNGGSFIAPAGASEILLGINDDNYADNTGALTVRVSGANLSPVPLPAAAPMFGGALLVLSVAACGIRRRTKASESSHRG